MKAKFGGYCDRCDGPIHQGDEIVLKRGVAIHAHCASGQDD